MTLTKTNTIIVADKKAFLFLNSNQSSHDEKTVYLVGI